MILSFEQFKLLTFKLVMKGELFIAYSNRKDHFVCKFDYGNGLSVTCVFKMDAKYHVPVDE